MVNRTIALLISAVSLVGCNYSAQPEIEVPKITNDSAYQDFSMQLPKQIIKTIHRANKSDAYLTYDNTTVQRELTDFSIHVYPPESIRTPSSCSPSITGASRTSPLETTSGKTNWGRVDAYDTPESLDREPVLCSPPKVSWLIDAEGNAKLESSAYALCSEKDGKTVVICIGQMTDNPEMAKQIFETFRWTE